MPVGASGAFFTIAGAVLVCVLVSVVEISVSAATGVSSSGGTNAVGMVCPTGIVLFGTVLQPNPRSIIRARLVVSVKSLGINL